MDPKNTLAVAFTALLAGAGIGRATVASAPATKFERICVEADGSAQIYADADGRKRQLLVPPDHKLAVMARAGGKVVDKVPTALDAAIKSVVAEASKLAALTSK